MLGLLLMCFGSAQIQVIESLEQRFKTPPASARPWVYWWCSMARPARRVLRAISRKCARRGSAGCSLFDAGEVGPEVPRGPEFMSPQWRDLFKYALREANRCGITLTVNLCTGWDCGGHWVTSEHAAKKLSWSQTLVKGPGRISVKLPQPLGAGGPSGRSPVDAAWDGDPRSRARPLHPGRALRFRAAAGRLRAAIQQLPLPLQPGLPAGRHAAHVGPPLAVVRQRPGHRQGDPAHRPDGHVHAAE